MFEFLRHIYNRLMYGPPVRIHYIWRNGFFGIYDNNEYSCVVYRDLVGLKCMELALAGFIITNEEKA